METSAIQQRGTSLLADTVQATKALHQSDPKCRFAMEIGLIGLTLMIGMSLFGASPSSNSPAVPNPQASYSPQPVNTSAPVNPANPTVSQAQLNAINQQAGGGKIINTLPVEPIKVTPVFTDDEAKVEHSQTDPKDPYTYTGKKSGPRPAYQEDKQK